MPNPENLKGHEFKPGESGNPAGRPKGSRNLSTLLRAMLDEEIEVEVNGKKERKQLAEVVIRKLIKKAADGSERAIGQIFDRVDGKAREFIEVDIPNGITTSATHEVIFRDLSKPEAEKPAAPAKKRKPRKR